MFDAVTFMDRNEQLVGSQTFNGALFDVYLQVRFTHLHMTIFTWESVSGERWFQLFVRGIIFRLAVFGDPGKELRIEHMRHLRSL